jgi:hypothetical protein
MVQRLLLTMSLTLLAGLVRGGAMVDESQADLKKVEFRYSDDQRDQNAHRRAGERAADRPLPRAFRSPGIRGGIRCRCWRQPGTRSSRPDHARVRKDRPAGRRSKSMG